MTAERLGQVRLAIELRLACDAAMILDPLHGPNRHAERRLKRLLTAHPDWSRFSHVTHNLGSRRIAWLEKFETRLRPTAVANGR